MVAQNAQNQNGPAYTVSTATVATARKTNQLRVRAWCESIPGMAQLVNQRWMIREDWEEILRLHSERSLEERRAAKASRLVQRARDARDARVRLNQARANG